MYIGASPGNFQQLSFYDAMRGELYRDFADPIGMAARSLVEGLFGIHPDAFNDTLRISPGFPEAWDHASLNVPGISIEFKRTGKREQYIIEQKLAKEMNLILEVPVRQSRVRSVSINGIKVRWRNLSGAVGQPRMSLKTGKHSRYVMIVEWADDPLAGLTYSSVQVEQREFNAAFGKGELLQIRDPQDVFKSISIQRNQVHGTLNTGTGNKTAFVKVRQGDFEWWSPIDIQVKKAIDIIGVDEKNRDGLHFNIVCNGGTARGKVTADSGDTEIPLDAKPRGVNSLLLKSRHIVPGTNIITCTLDDGTVTEDQVINWNLTTNHQEWSRVDLTNYFNDRVTNIFRNQYLSPRPASPTLQLPWQGVGNWCYPLVEPPIDDSGIRNLASADNTLTLPQGIIFTTPAVANNNIIFTSKWDNYPDSVVIPLDGHASHIYLLMAGSTNPMQSRFTNGIILVEYTNNTTDILHLRNPENWWPIEQDYYIDGYAFRTNATKPVRIHLKTGVITHDFKDYTSIKGFTNFAIDGGAATVLDLPLDKSKELKSIMVKAVANDVVIGLMSLTLMR